MEEAASWLSSVVTLPEEPAGAGAGAAPKHSPTQRLTAHTITIRQSDIENHLSACNECFLQSGFQTYLARRTLLSIIHKNPSPKECIRFALI